MAEAGEGAFDEIAPNSEHENREAVGEGEREAEYLAYLIQLG